jgi:hypothetical protein
MFSVSHPWNTNIVLSNVSFLNYVDWFLDTSINQHVTPALVTLIGFEPYLGNDLLYVDNGKALSISNIRHTTLHTL